VLKSGMGSEDGVVGLDNGGGDLRCRVDAELELALLAVVDGEALHEEGTKTGTGTTTEGVEDEEALEARAVVGNVAHLVEDLVNELLANGVVATGVVVGGILLAGNHLLGVEERTVGTGADLIDNVGLEIAVDGTRHVLAVACAFQLVCCCRGQANSEVRHTSLGEESGETLVVAGGLALLGEETIGLYLVSISPGHSFEAVY
jgi:hypothetical protein